MSRDRLWHVYSPGWEFPEQVWATSERGARAEAKLQGGPTSEKLYAHFWDCQCEPEELFARCLNAEIEAKLKGTHLGWLSGL